jgi:thiamine pyrophosphate-dependent acetolactate synthase large subunit-like protein
MGYGLPAALGAKVARPDCLVIDIDGDASFNMTLSDTGGDDSLFLPVSGELAKLLDNSLGLDRTVLGMGYGLPAALGAKVARPDCLVIDIDGDASFNMTLTGTEKVSQLYPEDQTRQLTIE